MNAKQTLIFVISLAVCATVTCIITVALMPSVPKEPKPVDTRTVNEILDDRYKACVSQTGAKWIDQCKLLLNAKI